MTRGPHAAITTKELAVPPRRVWEILADGRCYADWVVGASHIRDVEPDWPAVGSRFHHTVGVWPFHLRDTTAVEECEVGHRLVLEARARPFGRARVEITVEKAPTGSRIVISEEARSPLLARWSNPLLAPLIHVRNVEALRRLAELCEEPIDPPGDVDDSPQGGRDDPHRAGSALDKELADSFPASDPSSSWGGTT